MPRNLPEMLPENLIFEEDMGGGIERGCSRGRGTWMLEGAFSRIGLEGFGENFIQMLHRHLFKLKLLRFLENV